MNSISIHPTEHHILPLEQSHGTPNNVAIRNFVSIFLSTIIRQSIKNSPNTISFENKVKRIYKLHLTHFTRFTFLEIHTDWNLKPLCIAVNKRVFRLDIPSAQDVTHWMFNHHATPPKYRFSLSGRDVEIISTDTSSPLENSFWDTNNHESTYIERIYPPFTVYFHRFVRSNDCVLELCGGNGFLTHGLLMEIQVPIDSYTFIERNDNQFQLASRLLGKFGYVKLLKVDLATCTLKDHIQPVNMVIGCGALTRSVLTREVAQNVFLQVASLLKPGGYLLLTGWEISWIDAHQMRAAGFDVFNTYNLQGNVHLYAARKQLKTDLF